MNLKQRINNQHLLFGVLTFNPAHIIAPGFCIMHIGHSTKVNKAHGSFYRPKNTKSYIHDTNCSISQPKLFISLTDLFIALTNLFIALTDLFIALTDLFIALTNLFIALTKLFIAQQKLFIERWYK